MTTWTSDELTRIERAEELQIASLRRDGTLGSRRTIWVVRLGDDICIRSVNGPTSAWYRGTRARQEGREASAAAHAERRSRRQLKARR
ncbi:DUF2255 family protein [Actinacidiphila soli]|uniref:DUF2255 family protein n=1 Tax=Actinacidiphila soli TaxID=2487275 RepID=UPI000FCA7DF4|nr:DUF2255 family protein [Actinacidiphila soli]